MRSSDRKTAQILAFPALQAIPAPEHHLVGMAYEKYLDLAKGLLNSRKLNSFTRSKCELIAILHEQMAKRRALNQVISAKSIEDLNKLMKELQLVDESESTAPVPVSKENRYSRIGVIVRSGAQKAEIRAS